MSNTAPITTMGITTPSAIATESEKANFMVAKETAVSLQHDPCLSFKESKTQIH